MTSNVSSRRRRRTTAAGMCAAVLLFAGCTGERGELVDTTSNTAEIRPAATQPASTVPATTPPTVPATIGPAPPAQAADTTATSTTSPPSTTTPAPPPLPATTSPIPDPNSAPPALLLPDKAGGLVDMVVTLADGSQIGHDQIGWVYGTGPDATPAAPIVVLGHRTTHGGPFRHLDQLVLGDTLEWGTATFTVAGYNRLSLDEVAELLPTLSPTTMLLVTCDPPGRAVQRLVVVAEFTLRN